MATTTGATLNNSAYTLIGSSVTSGYIENPGQDIVRFVVASSLPSINSVKHNLLPAQSIPFSFSAASNIYAASTNVPTGYNIVTTMD